jgi:hypothetical protein
MKKPLAFNIEKELRSEADPETVTRESIATPMSEGDQDLWDETARLQRINRSMIREFNSFALYTVLFAAAVTFCLWTFGERIIALENKK